jgi:hypothetical protein
MNTNLRSVLCIVCVLAHEKVQNHQKFDFGKNSVLIHQNKTSKTRAGRLHNAHSLIETPLNGTNIYKMQDFFEVLDFLAEMEPK